MDGWVSSHNSRGRGGISAESLAASLRGVLASPKYVPPPFPSTALELATLARNPGTTTRTVCELLETEPLLASTVLNAAQSTYYGRGVQVETIEQAVVRLGATKLSDVFMEATVKTKLFQSKGFESEMMALRHHSIATAHIARLFCEYLGIPSQRAFLAGLLHDVGTAACFVAIQEH